MGAFKVNRRFTKISQYVELVIMRVKITHAEQ